MPGGTVVALLAFGVMVVAVGGLAVFAGTSTGAPAPERRPPTPGSLRSASPTAAPVPTTVALPIDAASVRRASRVLGAPVEPVQTWRPFGANLAAYIESTGQLRRQFESGAAYVSLINVAHRRETISTERRLVALLALADLAKSTEQAVRSLTPPAIATTYHLRLVNVLDSYSVAAREYWRASVRPTNDTLDAGTRRRQLNGVLDAAFRYNTLPKSPLDGDALGEP
ncbi:MAG: hypothetical protein OXP73_03655 [Chloroflexota bacterium]|nr:hypothetical protein [Chloroflexota bacterium]